MFSPSEEISRSEIVELDGHSMLRFAGNCQTVFKVAVPLCINISCCSIFICISKSHSFYPDPLGSNNLDFIACLYLILPFDPLWTYWLYLGHFPSLDPRLRIQYSSTFSDPHSLCREIQPLLAVENCCFTESLSHIETLGMIFKMWPTSVIGYG